MIKGIINAFDHMEFCLVINLTTTVVGGKGTVLGLQVLLPGMLVLLLAFKPSSKYLLPIKKLISNTGRDLNGQNMIFTKDCTSRSTHCHKPELKQKTWCKITP